MICPGILEFVATKFKVCFLRLKIKKIVQFTYVLKKNINALFRANTRICFYVPEDFVREVSGLNMYRFSCVVELLVWFGLVWFLCLMAYQPL